MFRPEGATECCHGWSAAQPVERVLSAHDHPGGVTEPPGSNPRIHPVLILNLEILTPDHPGFTAKAVLNHHGIIFLPVRVQHRDIAFMRRWFATYQGIPVSF